MDELIKFFINNYYTDELKIELNTSFDIFSRYEYNEAYSKIIDLLNDNNFMTSSDAIDSFTSIINSGLDFILKEHTITLNDNATIVDKNELLIALLRIQDLEDYESIICVLESLETDEEKLSLILSDLCKLDQIRILTIIDSFNNSILKLLKQFIYKKEKLNSESIEQIQIDIETNLKLFIKFKKDNNLINNILGTMVIGSSFNNYLSFFGDDIIANSDEETANNILALLYMSLDGYVSPLSTYRIFSYDILQNLDKVSKIETIILNIINAFNEFKKVENEKNRLS